jgi:hypothetical protein
MSGDTFLDRLRARAEGRLPPVEAQRLERELEADPRLRELAAEFEAIHSLTGAGELPVPACELTYEDLAPQLPISWPSARPTPLRRVAAAAGIALLAGAGAFVWTSGEATAAPLVLKAIELEAEAVADAGPDPTPPPAVSLDFDPRGADGVRWIADLEDAVWLADATGRPLLVYGSIQGCILCATLDDEVFNDPQVLDLFERYVPVRIDFGEMPMAEAQALMARGYPFLEVWDVDQESCFKLSNAPDPTFFVESMHDGLEAAGATGEVPSWDTVRALCGLFSAAQEGERSGSMAAALERFRNLAGQVSDGIFAELADHGLRRIARDARERLLEARRASPDEARELLRDAAQRFTGTEYGADLRAVLERLERDGRFPEIVAPVS